MDRFKLNPIIKKDLRVNSRTMKLAWELFAYLGILGLVFLLMFSTMRAISGYGGSAEMYSAYVVFFPVLTIMQLGMISLSIPVITASSVSGEVERGTLDTLLTTTISYKSIAFGKMMSAVIRIMIFILASLPLIAVAFMFGGLSWLVLLEFFLLSFVFAVLAGSIGVYCSSRCRKTITSVLLSFGFYALVGGGSFLPLLVLEIIGLNSFNHGSMEFLMKLGFLGQLINPVFSFVVFYLERLTSLDIVDEIYDNFLNANLWLFLSVIVQLLLAYFFISRAAKRIDPMNEKIKKRVK